MVLEGGKELERQGCQSQGFVLVPLVMAMFGAIPWNELPSGVTNMLPVEADEPMTQDLNGAPETEDDMGYETQNDEDCEGDSQDNDDSNTRHAFASWALSDLTDDELL